MDDFTPLSGVEQQLRDAATEAHTILAGFCGAMNFEEFSSPAMRARMIAARDELGAALAGEAGQP